MNHRSLAFRLGAWYALLLSVTFALVGAAGFFGLQHYVRGNLSDSLRRRSEQVQQVLASAPADVASASIAREIETRIAPEFNNRFVRITRGRDTIAFRSGPPADGSFDPSTVSYPPLTNGTSEDRGGQALMVTASTIHAPSGDYRVEMGASTKPLDEMLNHLWHLLALLLPILILCAASGGYLLVRKALKPVDRMSHAAEQMSLQDVILKLPVVPSGDALERLSISLNGMLGRLRDSVNTSRRFLADASHELRTPLTVIKGELQEMVSKRITSEEDLCERVGSVLEEVARLERLVSGLLVLSRLDAGDTERTWEEVDLAQLASSTAEQMRLIAEDRGTELDLSALTRVIVHGNPARLKQVVVNLLDNAIRFTQRGGKITMRTEVTDSDRIFEIIDTGIGIPPNALPQVFDRFYRVDEARSRDDGGAGLGLAIVKSICTAHGADIEVESRTGCGSCFRVKFPHRLSTLGAAPLCSDATQGGSALGFSPDAIRMAAMPVGETRESN